VKHHRGEGDEGPVLIHQRMAVVEQLAARPALQHPGQHIQGRYPADIAGIVFGSDLLDESGGIRAPKRLQESPVGAQVPRRSASPGALAAP